MEGVEWFSDVVAVILVVVDGITCTERSGSERHGGRDSGNDVSDAVLSLNVIERSGRWTGLDRGGGGFGRGGKRINMLSSGICWMSNGCWVVRVCVEDEHENEKRMERRREKRKRKRDRDRGPDIYTVLHCVR